MGGMAAGIMVLANMGSTGSANAWGRIIAMIMRASRDHPRLPMSHQSLLLLGFLTHSRNLITHSLQLQAFPAI